MRYLLMLWCFFTATEVAAHRFAPSLLEANATVRGDFQRNLLENADSNSLRDAD